MPEAGAVQRGQAARGWWVMASMAVPMLLLQLGGTPVRMALRFERGPVMEGELWRLVSAHLVHLGWVHCLLNLTGLVLCLLLAPELFRSLRALWGRFLLLAGGISLLMLFVPPPIPNYVGLSGVLYGFFVLGLLPQARRDWVVAACLAFIVGRMVWQLVVGASPHEEALIGGYVVGESHLYGVVLALAMLAVSRAVHGKKGA